MKRRIFLLGCAAASVAGCTVPNKDSSASDEVIARAAYRHDGPPALTLYTMVNNRTGAGAHTSLMINASQRVIFDPAGSVRHSRIPERGDVLYGITPMIEDIYVRAHARETYHAVIQHIDVPAAVAEKALRLAQSNGAVAQAQCAKVTSGLIAQLPGFEAIKVTWYPKKLSEQFGALPGVSTRELWEDDPDDKAIALAKFDEQLAAAR